jgi:hypothetical protein
VMAMAAVGRWWFFDRLPFQFLSSIWPEDFSKGD